MSDRPEIRILGPGDEAVLEAFLLPCIESSMFLIGNSRSSGLVDCGEPYQGTYAAAFQHGRIIGVVAHYWNRNLVFQAPALLDALWRAAAEASKRPIGGLIGPDGQVAAAKRALALEDSSLQLDEVERLYSLALADLIVPEPLCSGQVRGRRIAPGDVECVAEWSVAYSVEALGERDSSQLREMCRAAVERSLVEGRTWVLECGRELLACSSFNAAVSEAVQVGGVWTPPALRRRGYGRAVVAASLLDARSEGVGKAILFTGRENIAAQKAYTALGFRHIGDYRILLLRAPLAAASRSNPSAHKG